MISRVTNRYLLQGDTKALAYYVARCQTHMRRNLKLRKYTKRSLICHFISTRCRIFKEQMYTTYLFNKFPHRNKKGPN